MIFLPNILLHIDLLQTISKGVMIKIIFQILYAFVLVVTFFTQTCVCSNQDLREIIKDKAEIFETFEEDLFEWRSDNGTTDNTEATVQNTLIVAGAIAKGVVGAAIAIALLPPLTLPVYPPQGVPQPGNIPSGGGLLPTTALLVISNIKSL